MKQDKNDVELSESEKRRILREEQLRLSIRQTLEVREQPRPTSRLWSFLNSSFGLFLLSSVLIGGLGKAYADYQQKVQERAQKYSELVKISTEINVRVTQLTSLLRELSDAKLTPEERGYKTVFIWRIIVADEKYIPSFPEFKGNHFSGLVSRLKLYGISQGTDEAIAASVAIEDDARRSGYALNYKDLTNNIQILESLRKELLARLSREAD